MLTNSIGIIGLISLAICIVFTIKRNTKIQLLFAVIAIISLLVRSILLFLK